MSSRPLPSDTPPALDIGAVIEPLTPFADVPHRKTPMLWKRLCFTLGIDVPNYLKKNARHRRGIRKVGA